MTELTKNKKLSGYMEVEKEPDDILRLILAGRLDSDSIGGLWHKAQQVLQQSKPKSLIVDAREVTYCDGAGVSLLLNLAHHQKCAQAGFEIQGLPEKFRQLMELFDPGQPPPLPPGCFGPGCCRLCDRGFLFDNGVSGSRL